MGNSQTSLACQKLTRLYQEIFMKLVVRLMNSPSKAYLRVIRGTNVKGQGSLAALLLGAVLLLVVFILFMVGLRGTEWFWDLLKALLERIKFWQ